MTKSISDQIETQEKLKQQADAKLKDLKKRKELKDLRDENLIFKNQIVELSKLREDLSRFKHWTATLDNDEKIAVISRDEVADRINKILESKD